MWLQHFDGGALVRLEVPVVQCDHNFLVKHSLQGGAILLPGVPSVGGLPPVPEDPGIGLTPSGPPEGPEVEVNTTLSTK